VNAVLPTTVDEAIGALGEVPDALVLAGGTDLMVAVNAGWTAVPAVVALSAVDGLREVRREGDELVVGAMTTYTEMLTDDVAVLAPALAQAARTVGSPQIRNAGTIGGNLATASPAGDTLPVLAALDATVELVGPDGARSMPVADFLVGPKQSALGVGELITSLRIPVVAGPQQYRKVGVRNAMVIAVASLALVVDRTAATVQVGLGSVGPVPLRAPDAEAFAASAVDWSTGTLVDPSAAARFGELVAEAAQPIDDHRSSASYRRHALSVLARRALATSCAGPTEAAA
jgi:CO/xanthine dehydrogenase FAD-binding subunit